MFGKLPALTLFRLKHFKRLAGGRHDCHPGAHWVGRCAASKYKYCQTISNSAIPDRSHDLSPFYYRVGAPYGALGKVAGGGGVASTACHPLGHEGTYG